jgi:SdpC family antimicrobial peptide
MKNKILISAIGVLLLAFAISCNDEEDNKPLQNYSGEDLFQAIFFSYGDAAQYIQTIQLSVEKLNKSLKTNPEIKQFSDDFRNEIVRNINELDPTYFTRFKEQLASDNFYSMELALNNGVKMIKASGYRSSYAGMFRLMDDLNEKSVDLNVTALEDLDYTKEEDIEKLKNFLKEEYAIDLTDDDYKIGADAIVVCYVVCPPVIYPYPVLPIVVLPLPPVYAWVEVWGGDPMMEGTAGQNALVQELANLL